MLDARELSSLIAVCIIALSARLAAAAWAPDIDSAGFYLRRAQELLGQLPWTGVIPGYWIHPPGMSILVLPALVFHLGYRGAQATVAFLSAAALPALWLVARRAGRSRSVAGLWCVVVCLSPAFFFSGGQVLPDVCLVTVALWMFWAVQTNSIILATVLSVAAVLLKEDTLVLSSMGIVAAALKYGLWDKRTRKWLLPIVAGALSLLVCYGTVGIAFGYVTNPQHIDEFRFVFHQLTSPLAVVKRFLLVSWQALFLVGVGSAIVPLLFLLLRIGDSRPTSWNQVNRTSLAGIVAALMFLALHSIAGLYPLTRYMLPAATLLICSVASFDWSVWRQTDRQINTVAVVTCALASVIWLGVDLRFIATPASVVLLSPNDCQQELEAMISRSTDTKPISAILNFTQSSTSSKVYTDTYMLRAIEKDAVDNDLTLWGRPAHFASQILVAMGHRPLLMTTDNAKRHALLVDFTPPQCWLAVTHLAGDPRTSRQLSTTRISVGNSKAYIVETALFVPECE